MNIYNLAEDFLLLLAFAGVLVYIYVIILELKKGSKK